jgi:ADP-ribosyl-[dinitrogen reductase] hydrolase
MQSNKVTDALIGLCVGDALGVPVEFIKRDVLKSQPVVGMLGYGTHNQSAGTWSDDSSLAFCLTESLCKGYNLNDIAKNFVLWYQEGYWTPHGRVFDIGIATAQALQGLSTGSSPLLSGGLGEHDNGNGSLMRIIPIIFYIKNKPIAERFKVISEVSSITHAHIRSILACFLYCEYALQLLNGLEKYTALEVVKKSVNQFLTEFKIGSEEEINRFHRLLENPIGEYDIIPLVSYHEQEISSSGYVLHTLEASIWCFLKTNSYTEAVLKAVNMGDDSDTTGCVTGGLAGIYYGTTHIPPEWIATIAKKEEIYALANKLNKRFFE